MALTVHTKDIGSKGHFQIFVFHFIPLLIIFALFLLFILWLGHSLYWDNYVKYYITLIPLTGILPLIIALTTALSYKRVILTVSPANNVNIDKLREFLFKEAYHIIKESSGNYTFERSRFMSRLLCLNFDKPSIEITPTEIRINLLKRLSLVLLPQLQIGKRFEINPDSGSNA